LPAGIPWHERLAVPDPPEIDPDESEQERFVELVVTARDTVLVKPFRLVTATVAVPAWFALTVMLVGFRERLKSGEDAGETVTV